MSDENMSDENITVTLRMNRDKHKELKLEAKQFNHSLGSYIESLIDQARSGKDVTLLEIKALLCKIDNNTQPKKQSIKKENKTAFEVELPNDLKVEVWEAWLNHLKKMNRMINYYSATLQLEKLVNLCDERDLDYNSILKRLIRDGSVSIYIPNDIIRDCPIVNQPSVD